MGAAHGLAAGVMGGEEGGNPPPNTLEQPQLLIFPGWLLIHSLPLTPPPPFTAASVLLHPVGSRGEGAGELGEEMKN